MIERRGFLRAMLAAGMAPAIAKAGVLMPVRSLYVQPLVLWGDGVQDDTLALQTFLDGGLVLKPDGAAFLGTMATGTFNLSSVIELRGDAQRSIVGAALRWDKNKPGGILVREVCSNKRVQNCLLSNANTSLRFDVA